MGYPPHALLSFGGDLGTKGEVWSCGLRMTSDAFIGASMASREASLTGGFADVVADTTAFFTRMTSATNGAASLKWFKWNQIDANGKYVGETTREQYLAVPKTGSGPVMPFNMALAISWETGVQRGLANHGRIYWPVSGNLPFDQEGQYLLGGSESPATVATAAKDWLDALNNWPGNDTAMQYGAMPRPAVVSRGRLSGGSYGPGLFRLITSVAVGSVPDTMRSRRNALQETYSRKTLAPL